MSSAPRPAGPAGARCPQAGGGQRFVEPGFRAGHAGGGANPPTAREVEVLRLTADGTPAREIAERLCLSAATVRDHTSAINPQDGRPQGDRRDPGRHGAGLGVSLRAPFPPPFQPPLPRPGSLAPGPCSGPGVPAWGPGLRGP
ncbi:response regulator transcription factor [Streptomyces sp. NPDC092370]|uniref:response regulator transcription factor n=1 Tax=Streptomyces sp. NPDC092370 TaxID=3366016 RepID=UPI00382C61ED